MLRTKQDVGERRYFLQVLLLRLWGTFDVLDVAVAELRDLRRDLDQARDTSGEPKDLRHWGKKLLELQRCQAVRGDEVATAHTGQLLTSHVT